MTGCLRFEYYDGDTSSSEWKEKEDRIKSNLKNISKIEIVKMINLTIANLKEKQQDKEYAENYHCLEPLLNEILKIGQIRQKNLNETEKCLDKCFKTLKENIETIENSYESERETIGKLKININKYLKNLDHFLKHLSNGMPDKKMQDINTKLSEYANLFERSVNSNDVPLSMSILIDCSLNENNEVIKDKSNCASDKLCKMKEIATKLINSLKELDENYFKNDLTELKNNIINKIDNKIKPEECENFYNRINTQIDQLINVDDAANKLKDSKEKIDYYVLKKRENAKIKKIHFLIEHLFYVFKRNTYYDNLIIKRVSYFIEDLFVELGLPERVFSEIWDDLKRHEDLMLYDIYNYRDHLMHQFHVFVLGYIFIHSYGLENIQTLLNGNYGVYITKYDIDTHCNDHNISIKNEEFFSKIDVLRIWSLTSLFHDCGYVFEKLPQGFEYFSSKHLGAKLESHFYWGDLLFSSDNLSDILNGLSRYFINCNQYNQINFSDTDIFQVFLKSAIIEKDHGILSAILLMQKHIRHSEGYKEIRNIEAIMNIASIAISFHNYNVYKLLSIKNNPSICLKSNPMAFILNYCDTAQEWGRKMIKKNDNIELTRPHLYEIDTEYWDDQRVVINNPRHFRVKLFYPADAPGIRPMTDDIKEKITPSLKAFSTGQDISLSIEYYIRNSRRLSFSATYPHCGTECKINEPGKFNDGYLEQIRDSLKILDNFDIIKDTCYICTFYSKINATHAEILLKNLLGICEKITRKNFAQKIKQIIKKKNAKQKLYNECRNEAHRLIDIGKYEDAKKVIFDFKNTINSIYFSAEADEFIRQIGKSIDE